MKALGAPRVLHFAVYAQNYLIKAAAGESRPDLIGLSKKGRWFVFEAKGRSNDFDKYALESAKVQAEQIQAINNLAPACSVACQAYFSDELSFRMDDPPTTRSQRQRTIRVTRSEFEHAYNDPIRALIDLRGADRPLRYRNQRFRGARIDEADLWIAVSNESQAIPDMEGEEVVTQNEYLGGDGVLVWLGPTWSEDNMKLQPHERAN